MLLLSYDNLYDMWEVALMPKLMNISKILVLMQKIKVKARAEMACGLSTMMADIFEDDDDKNDNHDMFFKWQKWGVVRGGGEHMTAMRTEEQ